MILREFLRIFRCPEVLWSAEASTFDDFVRRNCGASVEAMANSCRFHRSIVMTHDI